MIKTLMRQSLKWQPFKPSPLHKSYIVRVLLELILTDLNSFLRTQFEENCKQIIGNFVRKNEFKSVLISSWKTPRHVETTKVKIEKTRNAGIRTRLCYAPIVIASIVW